ncbi:MAG: ABC transporter ATP-binding protein [Calditrichaeota bacterium]|nr:ABC transporter ATP-binding protein [Calditrichota bacterium]
MNVYLRIIKYVKPYWVYLTGSLIAILFFTVFSSATLVSVIPFLRTIFQVEQTQTVSSAPATQSATVSAPGRVGGIESKLTSTKKKFEKKLNDFFVGKDRHKALGRICVLILIITFFKNFFDYVQAYLMAYVEQGVMKDIRNDLYRKIITMPIGFFARTKTGTLISRVTNDVNLVNGGVSASFVTVIKNPLLIIIYLILAIYLSWQLTLIALTVLPFSLLIIANIGLRLRKQSTESQEKMADVTSILQETIAGSRAVKAFAMEEFEIGKFKQKTLEYFRTLLKITRTRRLASPLTEFLGAGVAVFILWFGGQKVLSGNMLPPENFLGFLFVIFSLMQPVKELGSVNNRIQEAISAGTRIFRILDMQGEIVNAPNPIAVSDFEDAVVFDHVFFKYNEREEFVLKDVSLTVRKGDILAIVGPSGVGKSTLVDLVPRFYDPTRGRITLDGHDLRELDLKSLRQLMGIVTQETILFHETVRNNIAYGMAYVPLEEVIEAAKAANAHSFIEKLPQGYDTLIGERGIKLSGGQRQRIAIARALLKNPPILILDEATSALDTESEFLVQEAIERLMTNRTVFVIAHRLSTIQNASTIIVLEKGEIAQQGTHRQLLKQKGPYQRLYNMQFRLQDREVPEDV